MDADTMKPCPFCGAMLEPCEVSLILEIRTIYEHPRNDCILVISEHDGIPFRIWGHDAWAWNRRADDDPE